VHDEVEGELSGRACGPGQRPPGERHARRVVGPAFPLVWARCTREKRDGGPTAAPVKSSRPLIRVLVINDNHYGLTFLFEL
jgi:hypothetical protein